MADSAGWARDPAFGCPREGAQDKRPARLTVKGNRQLKKPYMTFPGIKGAIDNRLLSATTSRKWVVKRVEAHHPTSHVVKDFEASSSPTAPPAPSKYTRGENVREQFQQSTSGVEDQNPLSHVTYNIELILTSRGSDISLCKHSSN